MYRSFVPLKVVDGTKTFTGSGIPLFLSIGEQVHTSSNVDELNIEIDERLYEKLIKGIFRSLIAKFENF